MAIVDREDLRPAGMLAMAVLLVLGTALVLGLAVRIFLLAAGLR